MGLKAIFAFIRVTFSNCVEIRPKWDWKLVLLSSVLLHTFRLKSDQNGIESCNLRMRQLLSLLSWNQTKMGLKEAYIEGKNPNEVGWNQTKMGLKAVDTNWHIEKITWVEIRPKWDWKTKNFVPEVLILWSLKSDQNGIESRLYWQRV